MINNDDIQFKIGIINSKPIKERQISVSILDNYQKYILEIQKKGYCDFNKNDFKEILTCKWIDDNVAVYGNFVKVIDGPGNYFLSYSIDKTFKELKNNLIN